MANYWAQPESMVVALGPGGTPVDIRETGQYERWHGRDGLTCLDCSQPVNPRRLTKGRPRPKDILAHSPRTDGADADEKCESIRSDRRGHGWKVLLREAIRAQLESLNYRVEIDPPSDAGRIDLAAYARDRRVVIRIELDKVPQENAQAAHRALLRDRTHGYTTEVLWITFGCTWVDELPAVGIRFVNEPVPHSFDIAGVHVVVDAGVLKWHNTGQRLYQPKDDQLGLERFLDLYLTKQLSHHPFTLKHRGWAATRWWDAQIRSLLQQRDRAGIALATSSRKVDQLTEALEQSNADLARAAAQLASSEDTLGQTRELLTTCQRAREQTEARLGEALEWIELVERARTGRAARFALRKLPPFTDPGDNRAS